MSQRISQRISQLPSQRSRWFELRWLPPGMLAFMLHRLSGLALVFYLYLHLAVLAQLRRGPVAWDRFLAQVRSPVFLLLDALLLFGVLLHGLNGLRLTLVGLGIGLRWQQLLFWLCLGLSILLTAWGAAALFR